ncbi:PAS domain S-box protein [Candidatus Riflebacteria bacterium]
MYQNYFPSNALELIEGVCPGFFFYFSDSEGKFIKVSTTIQNILGYSQEEFLANNNDFITNNPINGKAKANKIKTLQGIQQPPYEMELFHKDGSKRLLKIEEIPIFCEGDYIAGIEGIAQDITHSSNSGIIL